jgi:hypothetical protein
LLLLLSQFCKQQTLTKKEKEEQNEIIPISSPDKVVEVATGKADLVLQRSTSGNSARGHERCHSDISDDCCVTATTHERVRNKE